MLTFKGGGGVPFEIFEGVLHMAEHLLVDLIFDLKGPFTIQK